MHTSASGAIFQELLVGHSGESEPRAATATTHGAQKRQGTHTRQVPSGILPGSHESKHTYDTRTYQVLIKGSITSEPLFDHGQTMV